MCGLPKTAHRRSQTLILICYLEVRTILDAVLYQTKSEHKMGVILVLD